MKYLKQILLIPVLLFVQSQFIFGQTANDFVIRAKADIDKKGFAAATTDSSSAIKLDANNADAFFWRGYAYYSQNDYPNALRDFDEAIRLNPQAQVAFGIRGVVHFKQQDFDKAIADYTRALELNPNFQSSYYNRGTAKISKPTPDWASALPDFTKAAELNPKDSDSFYQLGYVNSKLENWKEAEKYYIQAANLGDKTTELFSDLSYVDIKLGVYTQAAMNARQALEIDPNNTTAQMNLKNARELRRKPFDAQLAREFIDAAIGNDNVTAINALNRGADVNATITYYDVKQYAALHGVASHLNYFLVNAIISVGANVNAQDSNGNTALIYAVSYSKDSKDKAAIVKLLLKNGADVNLAANNGNTPLHSACLWAYDDLVEMLLEAGSSVKVKNNAGATALVNALSSGTIRTVQLLLAAGSDPNAVDNNGYSALLLAVRKNGFGLAKDYLLMKAGASMDLSGDPKINADDAESIAYINLIRSFTADSLETKLFDAATNGNQTELISLLAANPSINKKILNYLLMIGIYQNSPTLLEALLNKGADPNFQMNGVSVLEMAKLGKFTAASAAYLANYGIDTGQIRRNANNDKVEEFLQSAANLMSLGSSELIAARRDRENGKDKRTECLRVNEAANDLNYAIKYLDRALAIDQFNTTVKSLREKAVDELKKIQGLGCPVFLKP